MFSYPSVNFEFLISDFERVFPKSEIRNCTPSVFSLKFKYFFKKIKKMKSFPIYKIALMTLFFISVTACKDQLEEVSPQTSLNQK